MNEQYPKNWASLNLMVNTDTGEHHVVGGDRFPGEGDTGYIVLKRFVLDISPICHCGNTGFLPDGASGMKDCQDCNSSFERRKNEKEL